MDLNLEHKNALVCGSTQGIGKAAAFALASEGVRLTLVARNEAKLKDVIATLPNADQHDYIIADFMNPMDLKSKVETYIQTNHGFHILSLNLFAIQRLEIFCDVCCAILVIRFYN